MHQPFQKRCDQQANRNLNHLGQRNDENPLRAEPCPHFLNHIRRPDARNHKVQIAPFQNVESRYKAEGDDQKIHQAALIHNTAPQREDDHRIQNRGHAERKLHQVQQNHSRRCHSGYEKEENPLLFLREPVLKEKMKKQMAHCSLDECDEPFRTNPQYRHICFSQNRSNADLNSATPDLLMATCSPSGMRIFSPSIPVTFARLMRQPRSARQKYS